MDSKQRPSEKREQVRQKELKNNPTGSLQDGLNRASGIGNLNDLTDGLGWKGIGLLILVLFIGYVVYSLFFR